MNIGENVNSVQDDYSPVVVKDHSLIYFTTRRQIDEKDRVQKFDMKYNENIFRANNGPDLWALAGPAGPTLVTEMNEGVLYVNDENSFMYVYAGWSGNGDILISYFEHGSWTTPEPLWM